MALLASIAQGQDYRGRVQGRIVDSSAAVIAGATVILRNDATGVSSTRTTNESGLYLFDLVEPGKYTLTVDATGFGRFIQQNIDVPTQGDISINASLNPGTLQQTVDVSASAEQVQFNTSNLETTVDTVAADRMPQYKRSPFLLAQLDPSVLPDQGNGDWNPFNSWGPVDQSVGGGANSTTELQVDGSPTGVGVKNSYQPIPDSVEEVNVQQNSVDAEYGHSSGSAITITTKSGTNQWHGLAYYQGQYPWANAIEDRTSNSRLPNLDRKQVFGGTFSNPIIHNKLFNFFGVEIWQYTQPGTFTESLPTDAEKSGDFSQAKNADGTPQVIYNPYSTAADGSRTPLPGNKIPASMMNPIAVAYSSMLWEPNSAGVGPQHSNNYNLNLPVNYPYRNYSDRVDYNISDKLQINGRVGFIRTAAATSNPTGSPIFENDRGSQRDATQYTGNLTYAISPSTVLTARGDYHEFVDASNFVQQAGAPTFSSLWPNQTFYDAIYADSGIPKLVPRMSVVNNQGGQDVQMGAQNGWWHQTPDAYDYSVALSHQHGKHYLKGGGQYRLSQVKSALMGENPGFGFDAGPTAYTDNNPYNGPTNISGNAYATFLLGAIAPVQVGNQNCWACGSTSMPITIVPTTQDRYFAGFINDDWKISSRLTLNLGVRYEHSSAFYDDLQRLTAPLNLNTPNQVIQGVKMPDSVAAIYTGGWSLNGAYQFESKKNAIWDSGWGSLSPRVGFAYKINNKTSLRAAYARYYTPWEDGQSYGMEGPVYYGYSVASGAPPLVGGVPQMTLAAPFPASYPLTQATGKSLGVNTGLGDGVSFANGNRELQHSDRINVGVQTELPAGIIADVTYFFNHTNQFCGGNFYGGGCYTNANLDQMDPRLQYQYGASGILNTPVANPFFGLNMPGPLASESQVSIGSLMVKYPQYLGITEYDGTSGATMHYNSLQLRFQKRFNSGYSFLAGYNYHITTQQVYYDSLAQYLNHFTAEDSGLPRDRLTISGTWDLPFGRGRQYLSNANRLLDALVGGWHFTGLATYQSGAPIKFTGVVVNSDPGKDVPSGYYFNPKSISTLPATQEETNPWFYSGVNGPSFFNIDSSLVKDISITERTKFSLRMDAYNTLNNLNRGAVVVSPSNAYNGTTSGILNNTFGRQLQLGLRLSF
jgi:hypothetical protein